MYNSNELSLCCKSSSRRYSEASLNANVDLFQLLFTFYLIRLSRMDCHLSSVFQLCVRLCTTIYHSCKAQKFEFSKHLKEN